MILKYFYDKRLAQASYLMGCAKTGEAIVIDPIRDIQEYLDVARAEGLRITHIGETHIHADYVSGVRELANATGAMMYLSDMGDADWKYGYADQPNAILVRDGDRFMVGNLELQVMWTPGHTLEHIAFMVTDTAASNEPMGIFTGDFIFVGDIGRPDLLEEAAGFIGTKVPGARMQFESIQKFKALPDYLQLWPAHGAGSACGKALGGVPSTTLGYEKRISPAFQFIERDAFVNWLLDGQPEAPRYFAQMKKVNKVGPALIRELQTPMHMTADDLTRLLRDGELVIDLRPAKEFTRAHPAGSLSIPANETMFSTYVGWFVDFDHPTYLLVSSADELPAILSDLRDIGVDNVVGFFTPEAIGANAETLPVISASELRQRTSDPITILDVRGKTEYCEGHIVGARNLFVGYLPCQMESVPKDMPIITQCASGYRSHIAASWLQAHGYTVANLIDSKAIWSSALVTETCNES
jgi:hydroxyacylglutathione hydrolase